MNGTRNWPHWDACCCSTARPIEPGHVVSKDLRQVAAHPGDEAPALLLRDILTGMPEKDLMPHPVMWTAVQAMYSDIREGSHLLQHQQEKWMQLAQQWLTSQELEEQRLKSLLKEMEEREFQLVAEEIPTSLNDSTLSGKTCFSQVRSGVTHVSTCTDASTGNISVRFFKVENDILRCASSPHIIARLGDQLQNESLDKEYYGDHSWGIENLFCNVSSLILRKETLRIQVMDNGSSNASGSLGETEFSLSSLAIGAPILQHVTLSNGAEQGDLILEVSLTSFTDKGPGTGLHLQRAKRHIASMQSESPAAAFRDNKSKVQWSPEAFKTDKRHQCTTSMQGNGKSRKWMSSVVMMGSDHDDFGEKMSYRKSLASKMSILMSRKRKRSAVTFDDGIGTAWHDNRRWAKKVVESSEFEVVTFTLILLSSFFQGLEVETMASKGVNMPFTEIQCIYTFFFVCEVLLRMLAYRCEFFLMGWNMYDLFLAVFAVVELSFSVLVRKAMGEDNNPKVLDYGTATFLRTLRVLRNIRVIRMVRYFRELQQMMVAVCGSMKTLMWLGVLLLFLLYFFAVCFTSAVADSLLLRAESGEDMLDPSYQLLERLYGSLVKSMLTLFRAITNGESWGESQEPLDSIHWTLSVLYLIYIMFAVFAFMNAVTSVFVDNALRAAQAQKEHLVQSNLREKETTMKRLEELFKECDEGSSGNICEHDLEIYLQEERAKAYLATLGIETSHAAQLFNLLDVDDSGKVTIHDFVSGCMRLKGEAKSIDLAELKKDSHKLLRRLSQFMSYTEYMFDKVSNQFSSRGQKSPETRSLPSPPLATVSDRFTRQESQDRPLVREVRI